MNLFLLIQSLLKKKKKVLSNSNNFLWHINDEKKKQFLHLFIVRKKFHALFMYYERILHLIPCPLNTCSVYSITVNNLPIDQ